MPRVTPCRLLKLFLFGWMSMIFLWWALPSPTIPAHEREAHIQKTLASGRPLITVMDWTKEYNPENHSDMSSGKAYIARWQLKQATRNQGILLELGPDGVTNLTEVIAKAKLFNSASKGRNSTQWVPYFDNLRLVRDVPASDVEFSTICLPWFHSADKHFITHEMHGYSGDMTLRFVVPQPGVLELWLETVLSSHVNPNDYRGLDITGDMLQNKLQQDYFLEYWGYITKSDRERGILATFKSPEMEQVQDVVVVGLQGDLLSSTYPIRRALLVPLAPVWSIGFFLLEIVFGVLFDAMPLLVAILADLLLACGGIMLSCWLRDGRPEFSEWTRHFWMTRWIPRRSGSDAKKVWGPAGPVPADSSKVKWDEESAMLQRPPTVRLGRHWKR